MSNVVRMKRKLRQPHDFVVRVKEILEKRGLTQKAFELTVGLPDTRFSKWINGEGDPDLREAIRMAAALGVPLAELVGDSDPNAGYYRKLSINEIEILTTIQVLGLSKDEAIRLLKSTNVPPRGGIVHQTRTDSPIQTDAVRKRKSDGK